MHLWKKYLRNCYCIETFYCVPFEMIYIFYIRFFILYIFAKILLEKCFNNCYCAKWIFLDKTRSASTKCESKDLFRFIENSGQKFLGKEKIFRKFLGKISIIGKEHSFCKRPMQIWKNFHKLSFWYLFLKCFYIYYFILMIWQVDMTNDRLAYQII